MKHHAYFFEGSLSGLATLADAARAEAGFSYGNSNVQVFDTEKFGIGDALALRARAALKSSSGRALFVVGASSITREAQNALLKLFEEPQEGVMFVLLVPHGALLPTLRSRMLMFPQSIETKGDALDPRSSRRRLESEKNLTDAKSFLLKSEKERGEQVAALLKDEEGVKDRAREFLLNIERTLYSALQKKRTPELCSALEDAALARRYIGDNSSSLKMIFEHLAIFLPKV